MKITYIHHSCFVIEIEDCIFIFDYLIYLPILAPSKTACNCSDMI